MTEYNFDRAQREAEQVDALGKKWIVKVQRQNGLCYARPEPDREDAVIPKQMQGQWTKPSLLLEQINLYIKRTWDKAEEVAAANARTAKAAKEQEHADKQAKAKADEAARKAKVSKDAPAKAQKGKEAKAN